MCLLLLMLNLHSRLSSYVFYIWCSNALTVLLLHLNSV